MKSMDIKAFLRLIRLPNVFTAACNSLAGLICAGVGFDRWPLMVALGVVSMSIYAAGILLNDLYDLEEDRRERPDRPLPSGQISIRFAGWMVFLLGFTGLLIAWRVSIEVGIIATVLMALVDSYNRWLKKTPFGPWAMGLCRGLNFGLGLALAPLTVWGFLAVAGYTFYIAGITYISRQETYIGQREGLKTGFVLELIGLGLVIASMMIHSRIHELKQFRTETDLPVLGGIMIILVLLKRLTITWKLAFADPQPKTIQNVVKTGIINLPLIDFSLVIAAAGAILALPIAFLWVLGRLMARKLYTT